MFPKVSLDRKNGVFSLRIKPRASLNTELKGKVAIDYDEKGEITNIMIMKYSLEDFGTNESISLSSSEVRKRGSFAFESSG